MIARVATALVAIAIVVRPAAAAELGELERRAKAFYDLLERGQKEQAAAVFPDLEQALASTYQQLQDRLDQMRDEVMERDGDVEQLYRESRWRDPEIASLVITYHLAWVRYQGAQLTTDTKRKNALLDKAVEGFSQFLVVNEVPEVYAESQYGRGLAFLDLGNYPQAREDLEAAARDSRTAAKAKAALAELERRSTGKKTAGPAADEPETLLARMTDALPKAATDTAIEKDTTALARGLAARGGDWPRRVDAAIAGKLGSGTPTSVNSSYGLLLLAQLAIDRGRCSDVAALADAGADLKDASRARHRPELLFLDGACRSNAGKSREAAEVFGKLLQEFPDSPKARDAAYYRLRALDVARTNDASLAGAYEEALSSFVTRFPKDEAVGEAYYQLGERRRAQGDCAKADAEYGRVTSGPYAARARLGSLECAVGAFVKAGKSATPDMRRALVDRLRSFVRDVKPSGPDEAAVARAALMGGLVAADANPPDPATVVEFLDKYESRFPSQKEWHATAVQRRLGARVALGVFADAEHDLDAFVASTSGTERRTTLADLGKVLQKQLDAGDEARRAAALALARKVYRALVADGGEAADRIALADLEVRAGNAAEAAKLYDEVLATDATSAEALRGAARAAATLGDRGRAFARWKQIVESSPTGGTAWYEARGEQVKLLLADGDKRQACEVIRLSLGKSTTTGGDQLEKQLRQTASAECR